MPDLTLTLPPTHQDLLPSFLADLGQVAHNVTTLTLESQAEGAEAVGAACGTMSRIVNALAAVCRLGIKFVEAPSHRALASIVAAARAVTCVSIELGDEPPWIDPKGRALLCEQYSEAFKLLGDAKITRLRMTAVSIGGEYCLPLLHLYAFGRCLVRLQLRSATVGAAFAKEVENLNVNALISIVALYHPSLTSLHLEEAGNLVNDL